MTVAELIDKLKEMPQDAKVYTVNGEYGTDEATEVLLNPYKSEPAGVYIQ